MNEVEVHVIQTEFLQTGINGTVNVFYVGEDLGADEKFVPRNLAGFDGSSELGFGAVYFGAVEMDISKLCCFCRGIDEGFIQR